jgi:hypothetical protein
VTSGDDPRPLLLVDVDGVLSLAGARAGANDLVPALVEGIPHLLSRPAAAALARVVPHYECVWCTGWEERAGTHLPHLLGLPGGWRHLVFTEPAGTTAHWKLAAIDEHAGPDRALAWIDDAHDERVRAWASARPGPTLLVTTDPAVGHTPAPPPPHHPPPPPGAPPAPHAAELERWARQAAASSG